MQEIPIVPGRGLNSLKAIELRLEYLNAQDLQLAKIAQHTLQLDEIRYNIESFIGSTEIPIGIVGPLLFNDSNAGELVYCAAATLEGALVASMNRGAKAISQSGGFSSAVLHQRMVRAPMFLFENLNDAMQFRFWIQKKFAEIKEIAEKYSNHAKLIKVENFVIGKTVHLKFIFETGDASGQNMTTSCTWHAMMWIADVFSKETNISIVHFVIEGNGSSDKKISQASILNGRGIHVTAECFLSETVINKVLRTSSAAILQCFNSSLSMSKINGMVGYNINAVNAIAAIFAATGQDLASIAESSNAILTAEKTESGLYLSINLPSLVIGTIGGGTHLEKQREALELMQCYGSGKVERFARLIAGFVLALEISTYSAIVSGEFAKAHEKLGRNKPVKWLLKSELNQKLFEKIIENTIDLQTIKTIEIGIDNLIDNGIITNITSKVSKKIIGFIPIKLNFTNGSEQLILLKSKALDSEVIKGLHLLSASIDTALSDLINFYKANLEYHQCHKKELLIYELLSKINFNSIPKFYGKIIDQNREIYILAIEHLDFESLSIHNSENKPELWASETIKSVIESITSVHKHFQKDENKEEIKEITQFKAWNSIPLYKKMVETAYIDEENLILKAELAGVSTFIDELERDFKNLSIPTTLIHNDFNTRNIAIRNNGEVCIYDWELAVVGIPHRDIVEFLSFALQADFTKQQLFDYLQFHFYLYSSQSITWSDWKNAYIYSIKEYLATRVSFYATAGILIKYKFTDRVLKNCFKMLSFLNEKQNE